MPSRPSVELASSRTRLLQAAKRLFALQGYEQTATSAIAREAGTSESQLMRYFGGKVGLLDALFDEGWAELNQRVRTAVDGAATSRDALLEAFQVLAATLARDPDLATLFLFEGRRLRGEEPRVRLSEGFHAFTEVARGLVRKAQAARELDTHLDPGAITSALMGASEGMIRDRALARVGGGRAFAEREMRRTLDAMLTGFSSRPARARSTPRIARAR
jgi:AcrR family transcriptional regulator